MIFNGIPIFTGNLSDLEISRIWKGPSELSTNVGYGTTNADAGGGIGMLKGGLKKYIQNAIN